MSFTQLIYTSILNGNDESVLTSIHSHAVRNNTSVTITGMLIYYKGCFLQVLEGDKKTVHSVFEKIKEDTRHQNVHLLLEKEVEERFFSHWNMGYKYLQEDEMLLLPVYKNYLESEMPTMKQNPEMALEILKAEFT
jgi:hypothetical protein